MIIECGQETITNSTVYKRIQIKHQNMYDISMLNHAEVYWALFVMRFKASKSQFGHNKW